MLNKNVGPSGSSETTWIKKQLDAASISEEKKSVPEEKKRSKRSRVTRPYKRRPDAHTPLTIVRKYQGKKYTFNVIQVVGELYIQLLAPLVKFLGYDDVNAFCKDKPGAVDRFMTVAYRSKANVESPPLDSNVHYTSFIKYDRYRRLLNNTTEGKDFLQFVKKTLRELMTRRDSASFSRSQEVQLPEETEEIPDEEISLISVEVPVSETIPTEFDDLVSFNACYYAAAVKIVDDNVPFQKENVPFQQEITRLQQEHRQEIIRLQQKHQQEIIRLQQEHQQGLIRLQQEHQQEIIRLQQEITRIQQGIIRPQQKEDPDYLSSVFR
jgi:hypothetical protein